MTPTEAATALVTKWIRDTSRVDREWRPANEQLVERIASALAAARARGWREGIEAAAAVIDKLYLPGSHDVAAALRNLKQPQEPPHAP